MITKEQAREIATQFLRDRGVSDFIVDNIYWWDEIPFRKPSLYNWKFDESKCWVAYLHGPDSGFMLKSSDIIIISMDFGHVHYFGLANDEG